MKTTRNALPLPLLVALALSACSKEKTCPADETNVNDTCLALKSDPKNCGRVGNACAATESCQVGACVDCSATPGACAPAVVAACFNLNQVRPLTQDLLPATLALDTDQGPISIAALGTTLYAVNSTSSSVSAVTLSPPAATSSAGSLKINSTGAAFPDLEHVAAHAGRLWISNAGTSTLAIVDPVSGQVDEVSLSQSLGEFVSPEGIDFVGTKGYVALAAVNALAVLDVTTVPPTVTKRIDLQPLAAAGANAAPSRVVASGSRVYVTLNDLFDASFNPVPDAHGRLAVVDATTDQVVGSALDLGAGCLNASGLALSGTTLWVACGTTDRVTQAVSGGALVPVDIASATPTVGTAITTTIAAVSVAFCGGHGYAGAAESGTVLRFDPTTRAVSSALVCPNPGRLTFVPAVACAP
jgi:sugar lactone lactonase YvrE